MKKVLSLLLIGLITLYKATLSPFIGPSCRYYPTCSTYALDAIRLHGPLSGSWLALKRIFSCHPWGGSGYDPVPNSYQNQGTSKRAQRSLNK